MMDVHLKGKCQKLKSTEEKRHLSLSATTISILPYPHLGCQPLEQFIQTPTARTIISKPHRTESWRIHWKQWFHLFHMMKSEYDLEVNKTRFSFNKSRHMLRCKLNCYEKCTFNKHLLSTSKEYLLLVSSKDTFQISIMHWSTCIQRLKLYAS